MANGTQRSNGMEMIFLPSAQSDKSNNNSIAQQRIQKIGVILEINLSHLSDQEANEKCFSTVYTLCKKQEWSQIKKVKEEVSALVDSVGRTLLGICIDNNDAILFRDLVNQQIALTQKSSLGDTPLHRACEMGLLVFVKELVQFNLIDEENALGQTALHLAAFHGHSDIVDFLLKNKASHYSANWEYGSNHLKMTPFALAVIGGDIPSIDLFLFAKTPLPRTPKIGTLLHLAIFFHQNTVLKRLLTCHFTTFSPLLEEKNEEGQTPLMLASFLGNGGAIGLLIEKGVKLNTQDDEKGNTALHWAALGNQPSAASLLIRHEAKMTILNRDGLEAEKLAEKRSKALANYLRNARNKGSYTENKELNYLDCPPENLVFKGGGPKAIAFIGALEELEMMSLLSSLVRSIGTSGGAIFAALNAFRYAPQKIRSILDSLNLMELLDPPVMDLINEPIKSEWITLLKNLVLAYTNPKAAAAKTLLAAFYTTGICKGEKFRILMEKYIYEATGIEYCTFKELRDLISQGKPFLHLHVVATKIGTHPSILTMSSEDPYWDNVIISDAVRGSMGIPFVFEPHKLHVKEGKKRVPSPRNEIVIDGGPLYNLALETCDRKKYVTRDYTQEDQDFPVFNKRTLGLSLYSPEEKMPLPEKVPTNLFGFIKNFMEIYSAAESLIRNLNPYNQCRIIDISNCGVSLISFNLKESKKLELIESGKIGVKSFLKKQIDDFQGIIREEKKPKGHESKSYDHFLQPALQIGMQTGFYAHGICQSIQCNSYLKGEWVRYIFSKGDVIDISKVSAKICCSTCQVTFPELDKVALSGCTAEMNMGIDHQEIKETFFFEEGKAHVIAPFGELAFLQFKIIVDQN